MVKILYWSESDPEIVKPLTVKSEVPVFEMVYTLFELEVTAVDSKIVWSDVLGVASLLIIEVEFPKTTISGSTPVPDTLKLYGFSSLSLFIIEIDPFLTPRVVGSNITTTGASDHTDFGNIELEDGTQTRVFTIENSGTDTIFLSGSPIVSTTGDFSVTVQPSDTLLPGASSSFVVIFDPTTLGVRNGSISIINNDSDENPYNFNVSGTGVDPEIVVFGNSTSIINNDATPNTSDHTIFESTAVTSSSNRVYTISNTGTSDLTVSGLTISGSDSDQYSILTTPSSTISSGGSSSFIIQFSPTTAGEKNATLTFITNDTDEGTFNYSIRGTGNTPEIVVLGNSTSINNNDATPNTSDHTIFESTAVTSSSNRIYTISNTGTSDLTVSGLTIFRIWFRSI